MTSNALVSSVIGFKTKLQMLMTSISIGVAFFTNATLCFTISFINETCRCTNLQQCLNVVNLLHLINIGNKKHGVESKDKVGPFST
jgi:hypothetical protein